MASDWFSENAPAQADAPDPSPSVAESPLKTAPNGPIAGSNTALTAAVVSHITPIIERGLMELATNPNVAKHGAAIGRAVGGVAPIVGGAIEGGPIGALVGVGASAKGAWAGGKTGWFTGKLAQNVSGHVLKIAQEVAPYLEKAMGAQGVLDLAQMAEPARQDIGVLGIGRTPSAPTNQQAIQAQQSADLGRMKQLVDQGSTPAEAAAKWSNGSMSRYAELMNLYLKAAK